MAGWMGQAGVANRWSVGYEVRLLSPWYGFETELNANTGAEWQSMSSYSLFQPRRVHGTLCPRYSMPQLRKHPAKPTVPALPTVASLKEKSQKGMDDGGFRISGRGLARTRRTSLRRM